MSVGVGILGFAHGHVHAYCSRWRDQPEHGVRIVAGWDRDSGCAQNACKALAIECVPSVGALLSRRDISAVVIASETALHAELVEQAAAAGKAVVLQKPMALTLDQADRIVGAAERPGVPFTMAWQMRMAPHNLQLIELQQRRGTLPGADHFPPPSLWEGSGGGIRGPSPFPLPAGEGMRLSCISFPRVNNIPWPPSGIQLKWYLHQAGEWTISDLPEIRDHGERIAGLAGPLAEFLRRERPAIATAQDGRNALRLVLACYASAEQGRRIYLW